MKNSMIKNRIFITMIFQLLIVASCGLNNNFQTSTDKNAQPAPTSAPVDPATPDCQHPDAEKSNPWLSQHSGSCIFKACDLASDPNYEKVITYKKYIATLPEKVKQFSFIEHDPSKCQEVSTDESAKMVKFIQPPSQHGYISEVLEQLPVIAILNANGKIVPENKNILLELFSDEKCEKLQPEKTWEMKNNNPDEAVHGELKIQDLKMLKAATYYLKASSEKLIPDCVGPISIVSRPTLPPPQKVVFIEPFFDEFSITNHPFEKLPKAAIMNELGEINKSAGQDITLSLHTDKSCSSNPSASFSVDVNPITTSDNGIVQFTNLKIPEAGMLFLKVSSPGLAQDCRPLTIADRLTFTSSIDNSVVAHENMSDLKVNIQYKNELNDLMDVPINDIPISLHVFSDEQCTQELSENNEWSVDQAKLLSENGSVNFRNLSIHSFGQFYIQARGENLFSTNCVSLQSKSNAKKIAFLPPYTKDVELAWMIKRNLVPSPMVVALDSNNSPVAENIPVMLELFADEKCTSPASGLISNPVKTDLKTGEASFTELSIQHPGVYYLKATSMQPGIASDCSAAKIAIAGNLNLSDNIKNYKDSFPVGKPLMDFSVQIGRKLAEDEKFVPIELKDENIIVHIYTNAECNAKDQEVSWFMDQNQSKTDSNGKIFITNLTFKKAGSYCICAEHLDLNNNIGELGRDCTKTPLKITEESNIASQKIEILSPNTFPLERLSDNPLESITVQIKNLDGSVANQKSNITLNLYTDEKCVHEAPKNGWLLQNSATSTETNEQGLFSFNTLHIKQAQVWLGVKSTDANIQSDCKGPILTPESLAFSKFPSSEGVVGQILSQQTSLKVVGTDRTNDLDLPVQIAHKSLYVVLVAFTDLACKESLNPNYYKQEALFSNNPNPGFAQFSNLSFQKPGTYYVKAIAKNFPAIESPCSSKIVIAKDDSLGCMNSMADNFNPKAKTDDCSCVFKFCPMEKPTPDSVQAAYNLYKDSCQAPLAPINNCKVAACNAKTNKDVAAKNAELGNIYKCDALKNVYDSSCAGPSFALNYYCINLKSTYQACFRRQNCSQLGLVDDAKSVESKTDFYNIPDQDFNFKNWFKDGDIKSFGFCQKFRYIVHNPGNDPETVKLYLDNCDCNACEVADSCNNSYAANFNPLPNNDYYQSLATSSSSSCNAPVITCDSLSNPIIGAKNQLSFIYSCNKMQEVYDRDCVGDNGDKCHNLKDTIDACHRREKCSTLGVVDDNTALNALTQYLNQTGENLSLFTNIEDAQFDFQNWKDDGNYTDFTSICLKLRPLAASGMPNVSPELVDLYHNYCDCTQCDNAATCNNENSFAPNQSEVVIPSQSCQFSACSDGKYQEFDAYIKFKAHCEELIKNGEKCLLQENQNLCLTLRPEVEPADIVK